MQRSDQLNKEQTVAEQPQEATVFFCTLFSRVSLREIIVPVLGNEKPEKDTTRNDWLSVDQGIGQLRLQEHSRGLYDVLSKAKRSHSTQRFLKEMKSKKTGLNIFGEQCLEI